MDTNFTDAKKDNGQDKSPAVIQLTEMDLLRYRLSGMEIVVARQAEDMARLLHEKAQLMEDMAKREHAHAHEAMMKAMERSRDLLDELGAQYGFSPQTHAVSTKGEVVFREMLAR